MLNMNIYLAEAQEAIQAHGVHGGYRVPPRTQHYQGGRIFLRVWRGMDTYSYLLYLQYFI